ncbi:MAG: hypothetical protein OEL83_21070 [Desulforhopalus sp.]|nr:hypothetical protein [Desulforhopalus sp.]
MNHDKIQADQFSYTDTKVEKKTWEKPKIIDLQVKETFGAWSGPYTDADKLRIS